MNINQILYKSSELGLYNRAQITSLIVNYGFIPVANADELYAIQSGGSETMGVGTIWAGTYTTGTGKNYIQVRDIDLVDYQAGAGWVPFNLYGIYDCNGLTITGLVITTAAVLVCGLFGINNGIIRNVNLTLTNIYYSGTSASSYIGSICGVNNNLIYNCTNTGDVRGYIFVGGIAGYNQGTINFCKNDADLIADSTTAHTGGITGANKIGTTYVSFCVNTGSITVPSNHAGGIVAFCVAGTIYGCANFGTITSSAASGNYIGGISGQFRAAAIISNCYNQGDIVHGATATYIGGVAPGYAGTSGTILNSYSTGTVGGNAASYRGGLIGRNNGGTVTNSYWDTDTSGTLISSAGTGRTTVEMKTKSPADAGFYVGWPYEIWDFLPTTAYPYLNQIPRTWQ